MRKVLVIGSGGAGKTTFAARLAECTGLTLIHLDSLYWQPGWIEPSKEEWARTVQRLAESEEWIMDGNYGGTLDTRLAAADTVIFLDVPRLVCLWRVLRRRMRYRGRRRPEMPELCNEHLTLGFVRWIWGYRAERRPQILERLGKLRPDQRVVILAKQADVDAFLASVPLSGRVADPSTT